MFHQDTRPTCWHQFGVQGAPDCKHFLFRFWQQHLQPIFSQTWRAFCVPGQDCFSISFLFFSFFVSTLHLRHSACPLAPQQMRRESESYEGSWKECQRVLFCQISALKEGCLSLPFSLLAVKTSVELLLPGSWWAYITLCVEESLVNTLKIRMLSHSMWSHDESSGKARLLKAQSDVSQPHISKRVMNQRKDFVQKQMLSVNYLKKNPTTFILWCLIHFLILHSGWSFFLKYESVLVFFLNLFSLVKRSAVGMCMSYRFYLTC